MKTFFSVAAVAIGLAGSASASVIDFDGFGHGDHVTSVLSTDGHVSATVSASGGINEAWAFDTTLSGTLDPDLEGDFDHYLGALGALDAGRALIIQEHNGAADDEAHGGSITFTFANAVDFTGFTLLDDGVVTVTSTSNAASSMANLPVPGADGKYGIFDTGMAFFGVNDLTFSFNHSGAIDSLTFVPAVPVPATLPLLLAGVGGFAALRRRKG